MAALRGRHFEFAKMEISDFVRRFKGVKRNGDGWTALCPAHQDRNASLSIGVGHKGIVIKCHAGCTAGDVVKAVGLELRDLFPDTGKKRLRIPSNSRIRAHAGPIGNEKSEVPEKTVEPSVFRSEVTLAEYAAAKGLPVEFLSNLGVRNCKRSGKAAIATPYLNADGQTTATRYRIAMAGDRFRWRSGAKPQLYGLWRLDEARTAGYVVVVEGESDAQTAWLHNIPAVGLPGAANWRDDRDAKHLDGIDTIYVVVEPDRGGEAVLKWLAGSSIRDRVRLINLGDYKDLSDLHLKAEDQFDELWQAAIADSAVFNEVAAAEADKERRDAFGICANLIMAPNILAEFDEAVIASGIVGDTRIARLLYLALTSRFFMRPISVVLKGPSSAGKSFTAERVLAFFPDDAYYPLTAMSDRALAYSEEPLEHRFIIIYEAAGLESDFATYLLRSLLSEGCVRYETVEKTAEGIKPRLIERKGPTGCLLTTTAPRLHPENETRLLSLNVSDSREQTRHILDRLADEAETEIDLEPWRALQTWLKGANHRVTIPFAKKLAAMVPEIAVRLRRDFHHVLTLIRSHALLHQCNRQKDADGRIIATLDDYAAIHDLVADVVAEGVEATVRPEVRQTVNAVRRLLIEGHDTVTVKQVAEVLRLDASAVSRRVSVARSLGYLKNEESRRRMPAKLVIGDAMPEDIEILPHPDRLRDSVHVCACDQGDNAQQSTSDPIVEELL